MEHRNWAAQMAFRFETLDIWRRAIEYCQRVYEISKRFPKSELYVLTSDLNRAAVSVPSNIAEGSGSETNREFKRYLNIAVKWVFETVSQLHIAKIRRYIAQGEFQSLYNEAEVLVKKIKSFRKTLK